MGLDKHLKNICEHTTSVLYGEKIPLYPCIRFISFVSPAHAQLLNTYCNFQHWLDADNNLIEGLTKTVVPKMAFNSRVIFGNYVKKPPKTRKQKLEKQINWVMQVFDVSSHRASEYLSNEKFLKAVKKRMKG